MSLAYGFPDLRTLDLCGCVLITDEIVVALANRFVHLRSLGLYYCRNITDRAMYSLDGEMPSYLQAKDLILQIYHKACVKLA
ncbi:hypothetical protein HA466_0071370 [Hirschfeldia incana]|nr:hypothetical protein HA466_0071370 [Hirschfeldia incana]